MRTPDTHKTFWERVVDAWYAQGLATSQLGIARTLGMSQGSVGRWARGEGLPELEVLRDIADRASVSIDWLLTGQGARRPLLLDEETRELLQIWGQLAQNGRHAVRAAAHGALALQQQTRDATARSGTSPQQK